MAEPRPIWYEKHPVSPERKAELRAAGYQVDDLARAPLGWKPPVPVNGDHPEIPEFLKVNRGD